MKPKRILISIGLVIATLYFSGLIAYMAWGHEHGHASGIEHLTGSATPPTARENYVGCPGQNKLLGHYDIDKNGLFDMCITMWQEHEEMHIIISAPEITGLCECKGYLWLEGDSQQ